MLLSRSQCLQLLRCPRSLLPLKRTGPAQLSAATPNGDYGHRYSVIGDLPLVVDWEHSVLDADETIAQAARTVIQRNRYTGVAAILKRLASPPNGTSRKNIARFIEYTKETTDKPMVLVVGGGSVGDGTEQLYEDQAVQVVAFDIYGTPNVQFVADAHKIPMADGTFDGVVVQAVLEHVLEPWVVVREIRRVLKPNGFVYAETPFMQQVHEGPYDFTRFTESGHRYLFRDFNVIAAGPVGGPGVQLLWSLDFFARSVFRSRTVGKLVKLSFFWLRYADAIVRTPYAVDTASGVYFLGRVSPKAVGPKEIIAYYQGAQR
jgi:SAM-dependent methyltransferase